MQTHVHAAWCFATSILWPNNDYSDEEVRESLACLQQYFKEATNLDEAFRTFCSRVVVAALLKKKCPILHPAIWLNPTCIQGLTARSARSRDLKSIMKNTPEFSEIIGIIATHFLQYNEEPEVSIIQSCKEALENIGYRKWMQTFYDSIRHQPTF
jgi:hypothetical protein